MIKGSRYNTATWLTMIPVCCGGAICAFGEPSKFAMVGLMLSLAAAIFRAARAVLQSVLMFGHDKVDAITMVFYSAPYNIGLFVVGSLVNEGFTPYVEIFRI
jgi:hypothetical protein